MVSARVKPRPAKSGVPIDRVLEVVRKAVEKDMSAKEIEQITRAVAHSAAKVGDVEEVIEYTEKVLDGRIKGEDVAISIYQWFGKKLEDKLKDNK